MPERLRAPLVLCYLQGWTRDEAARQLGWSLGTLKCRLEGGRSLLRARLEKRGLGLPAALVAAGLAESVTNAAVPTPLATATARAAAAFAAGRLAGSAPAALAEAALRSTVATKLRLAALALGGSLTAPAGWTGSTLTPAGPTDEPPRPVAEAAPRKDRYGDPLPADASIRRR